jgi:hypothetical protein
VTETGRNYPGIYIETKVPSLFPRIEKDLFKKLSARGWVGSNKTAPEGFDAELIRRGLYCRGCSADFEKTICRC